MRAEAVRRWGVGFMDAINGLTLPAVPRLAFADGGLVADRSGFGNTVLNMTVVTPDADSFRRSQGQIASDMRLALERAGRNL